MMRGKDRVEESEMMLRVLRKDLTGLWCASLSHRFFVTVAKSGWRVVWALV
jgi:hypothetical protein